MAIFEANLFVNCALNYNFTDSFGYEFAGNPQILWQSDQSQSGSISKFVQGSMFDEGFDIDFRTLLNSVNRRFSIANLLYFLY